MKFYVTYGCGSNLANCYSKVEAEDAHAGREAVRLVCGAKFAFFYDEEGFAGQVEQFGLREVPLQQQINDK